MFQTPPETLKKPIAPGYANMRPGTAFGQGFFSTLDASEALFATRLNYGVLGAVPGVQGAAGSLTNLLSDTLLFTTSNSEKPEG